MSDTRITQYEWMALVRRARMRRDRKLVALTLASYANAEGDGIRCGATRLALDCAMADSTARSHLAWLRNAGLVELVRRGNRRRRHSDEYRLILGPDVLEHVEILTPDGYDDARMQRREAAQLRQKRWRERHQQPVDNLPVRPVETVDKSAEAEIVTPAQGGVGSPGITPDRNAYNAGLGRRTPTTYTNHVLPTNHETREELRTDVAVVVDARPGGKPILRLITGEVA